MILCFPEVRTANVRCNRNIHRDNWDNRDIDRDNKDVDEFHSGNSF